MLGPIQFCLCLTFWSLLWTSRWLWHWHNSWSSRVYRSMRTKCCAGWQRCCWIECAPLRPALARADRTRRRTVGWKADQGRNCSLRFWRRSGMLVGNRTDVFSLKRMHTHTHTHTHTRKRKRTHTRTHTGTHTHIRTHTPTYVPAHTHTHPHEPTHTPTIRQTTHHYADGRQHDHRHRHRAQANQRPWHHDHGRSSKPPESTHHVHSA